MSNVLDGAWCALMPQIKAPTCIVCCVHCNLLLETLVPLSAGRWSAFWMMPEQQPGRSPGCQLAYLLVCIPTSVWSGSHAGASICWALVGILDDA
jgi:hypothetical protein